MAIVSHIYENKTSQSCQVFSIADILKACGFNVEFGLREFAWISKTLFTMQYSALFILRAYLIY